MLAPGSKPAEAVMEVDDVLWKLPTCLLSHDWWPLPLPWFPGPLCQHVWVLPVSKCSLAPTLPFALKHFVVLRACLRVSDLGHSWLPDVRAAHGVLAKPLFCDHSFLRSTFFFLHPRGTKSFSLLFKQFVSRTCFSCGPWRSLNLFSRGLG